MKNRPLHERFGFALAGLRVVFQSERSFRTECLCAVAAAVVVLILRPIGDTIDRALSALTPPKAVRPVDSERQTGSDRLYNTLLLVIIGGLIAWILHFVVTTVGIAEVATAFGLALLTLARVIVLLIFSTLGVSLN